MSGHAAAIRSYDELFRGGSQLVNPDALWKLMTEHKALVAEKQQLRDALERASVRLGELTQPPWNELTPLVAEVRDDIRAALDGMLSEDTE